MQGRSRACRRFSPSRPYSPTPGPCYRLQPLLACLGISNPLPPSPFRLILCTLLCFAWQKQCKPPLPPSHSAAAASSVCRLLRSPRVCRPPYPTVVLQPLFILSNQLHFVCALQYRTGAVRRHLLPWRSPMDLATGGIGNGGSNSLGLEAKR